MGTCICEYATLSIFAFAYVCGFMPLKTVSIKMMMMTPLIKRNYNNLCRVCCNYNL